MQLIVLPLWLQWSCRRSKTDLAVADCFLEIYPQYIFEELSSLFTLWVEGHISFRMV